MVVTWLTNSGAFLVTLEMPCTLATSLAQRWTYTLRSRPQMATTSIPRSTPGVTNCGDSRISSLLHISAVARKVCTHHLLLFFCAMRE